ncbi:MAG TPA: response regulator [Polyangiaceae bacterium]|nr:response regulator [Polyangiaceae bacterium]
MPKTLLAVDDSATMRKVLEITFGGEDFRVVTADAASSALSRLGEEPVAAVIDTSLGNDDGYLLAKEMRSRQPRLALVIMASRYAPYDANRGRDAGVDDYIDKPFDTQALIEKVKKALVSRETREVAKPAPAPAPAPAAAASSFQQSHAPRPPAPAAPAAPVPGAAPAKGGAWPSQRTHTLSFEGGLPIVPPPAARPAPPAPAPAAQAPAQPSPPTAVPRAPAPVAAAAPVVAPPPVAPSPPSPPAVVIATANGQFANKLGDLGLTAQQADAVLALSREVVERVVWEVVPQLAEAIIKEEIARLTKER